MATSQGMCKNCGSLIMFDDRDSTCECVFCNCVFPSSEAVEILENPEGRTFANEKIEKNSDSHHYTTRVYSTESLEKAIARDEKKRSQEGSNSVKDEFAIDAKDIKAPAKFKAGLIASIVAFVVIVGAIATPMYLSRTKLTKALEESNDAGKIYSGTILDHSFYGQSCQTYNLITKDEVDEATAKEVFDNYCTERAAAGKDNKSDVTIVIYCDGGIYTVTESGAEFSADETVKAGK